VFWDARPDKGARHCERRGVPQLVYGARHKLPIKAESSMSLAANQAIRCRDYPGAYSGEPQIVGWSTEKRTQPLRL
jgi:hypothetical protein